MLYEIRDALPVAIAPKYNIQIKAVRCSLRLLGINYAFVADKRTELRS
jgi:hypothetical protein